MEISSNIARVTEYQIPVVTAINEVIVSQTITEMLNVEGIVLEPAGALAIEALGEVADLIKGKTVVCVASGGNFDFERLPEVKERAQRYSGVKNILFCGCHNGPARLRSF